MMDKSSIAICLFLGLIVATNYGIQGSYPSAPYDMDPLDYRLLEKSYYDELNTIDHKSGLAAPTSQELYNGYKDRTFQTHAQDRQATGEALGLLGSVVGVVAAGASFLVAQTQISAVQNNINNLETEMQAMRLELNTIASRATTTESEVLATRTALTRTNGVLSTTCGALNNVLAVGNIGAPLAATTTVSIKVTGANPATDNNDFGKVINALLGLSTTPCVIA